MWCSLVRPADDDNTVTPTLRVMGWSKTDQACSGSDCNTNRQVELTAASSAWAGGELPHGLLGTDSVDTETWTSETCNGGGNCFRSDRIRVFDLNAASAGNAWAADELVLISIRRTEPSGTELNGEVFVSAVRLTYATTD
jgi:hypothetical protein